MSWFKSSRSTSATPTIGRIVAYTSQTVDYLEAPALITAVRASLKTGSNVPPLASDSHVHLTVFTPEQPAPATKPTAAKIAALRVHNVAGSYQVFDVPLDSSAVPAPGTWHWPTVA
jgi:hypothetical protein